MMEGYLHWIKVVWEVGDDVLHDQPLEAVHDSRCQSRWMVVLKPCYLAFLWYQNDSGCLKS